MMRGCGRHGVPRPRHLPSRFQAGGDPQPPPVDRARAQPERDPASAPGWAAASHPPRRVPRRTPGARSVRGRVRGAAGLRSRSGHLPKVGPLRLVARKRASVAGPRCRARVPSSRCSGRPRAPKLDPDVSRPEGQGPADDIAGAIDPRLCRQTSVPKISSWCWAERGHVTSFVRASSIDCGPGSRAGVAGRAWASCSRRRRIPSSLARAQRCSPDRSSPRPTSASRAGTPGCVASRSTSGFRISVW